MIYKSRKMSDQIFENVQNCCRICLDVESDHISILEDHTVQLHLKSCLAFSVSPQDKLPTSICTACVHQLNEFYNFQLNARCSQDWLESCIQEKTRKSEKTPMVQPLPDSEYNSDSLLEFLNNTANIEEYLNNLGKEDIPSIVNMLDRNNENSTDSFTKITKHPSPKKKDALTKTKNCTINMEIDVLDSDIVIVKEILKKVTEPKKDFINNLERNSCFACKTKFDSLQKLSQHISVCDNALRTCIECNILFDSRQQMLEHSLSHNPSSLICICGKEFLSKDMLLYHQKVCYGSSTAALGCVYRCRQCHEVFTNRFQMYKHAKKHVIKAEERMCDICGHSFIGNEALTKHKTENHEKEDSLLYRCKICSYTSPSHKDTYLHVQKHVEKTPRDKHLCETCGQSFSTHSTLLRHTLKHKKESYKCSVCNKIFNNVNVRDEHVSKHVEVTMCEKCGKSVSSFQLYNHSCL